MRRACGQWLSLGPEKAREEGRPHCCYRCLGVCGGVRYGKFTPLQAQVPRLPPVSDFSAPKAPDQDPPLLLCGCSPRRPPQLQGDKTIGCN